MASWRCLVGNGEAAARVLGLFCLINRGDIKSSALTNSPAGVSSAVLYLPVRSPGAISNVGESMVQFKPSDARYSSKIWANAFAPGL